MTSAAVAAAIDLRQRRSGGWLRRTPWVFVFISVLFSVSALSAIVTTPDGFVFALLMSSIVSRVIRSTELRFEGFELKDEGSRFLWESLIYLEFPILVPHRPGRQSLLEKEQAIRRRHRLS